MHIVGMVLHPARDSAEAVGAVLGWAERKGAQVLGIETEISVSSLADPHVREFAGVPDPDVELVVVARRGGDVVAVAYAAGGELLHVTGDTDLERHLLKAAYSRQ